LQTGTHVVIGALVDDRDVNYLGAEIIFNLSNEEVYIPNSMEGAVAAADQGGQLLAVKVIAIWHLGPIVTKTHGGVIGSESSENLYGVYQTCWRYVEKNLFWMRPVLSLAKKVNKLIYTSGEGFSLERSLGKLPKNVIRGKKSPHPLSGISSHGYNDIFLITIRIECGMDQGSDSICDFRAAVWLCKIPGPPIPTQ
jgi:hypothetical protein